MADLVFNDVLGEFKTLAALGGGANDALIWAMVETTGIEADGTIRDHNDFAALYAAANNEPAGGTYVRKTVNSGITITVDDTNNRVDIDMADLTWTALTTTGNNPISALISGYDPDTTTGTDSSIRCCTKHDFTLTPDGTDVVGVVATAGFYRAQ